MKMSGKPVLFDYSNEDWMRILRGLLHAYDAVINGDDEVCDVSLGYYFALDLFDKLEERISYEPAAEPGAGS
jgi:hypothetical protein